VSMTRRLGALAVVSALALTGCGAAQPGTAVEVGGDTISLARVDEVTSDFCEAIEPQLDAEAQTLPNSFLRGGIAGTLALRSAADQIVEERGLEVDTEQYRTGIAELRRNVAPVPEELRESVVEVESAPLYVEAVKAELGELELDGQGAYEDFVAAGTEVFNAWLAEEGVEFDPALNTALQDGNVATVDGSVSFAVSEAAKGGQAAEPNPMTARELPSSHRCGRG
jgi:hypothetical protein